MKTKIDVHCDKLDALQEDDVVLAQVDLVDVPIHERVVALHFLTAKLKEQFPHNRTVIVDEHVKLDVVRHKIENDEKF